MTYLWYAAVAVSAVAVAAAWPLSPAVAPSEAFQARLYAIIITAAVCTTIALLKRASSRFWTATAIAAITAAFGTLLTHFNASTGCVANYVGRPVVIGRTLTPHAKDYVAHNPGTSSSDLLLDAGGVPGRVWTPSSIRWCRFWLSWGGLSAVPLLAACVCASIARRRYRFEIAPTEAASATRHTTNEQCYDAFLSYRHASPDKQHACEILETLEAEGLRVAIDFRDFRPNEHFLSEMERCIKESRFTLCAITANYVASDHCTEEALISKALDMAERRRRLVPLMFERVELPVWLHGLVGVDFTRSAGIDPLQRLLSLLAHERPEAVRAP